MKKIYTSIDIGSDTIRVLTGEYYQDKLRVLAVSSVKSRGVKNGLIVDPELVTERLKLALDDIQKRIGVPIEKAMIILPAIDAEYSLVHGNIPIVNEESMVLEKDIVRLQNQALKDISPSMELVSLIPIDFTIYDNGSEIETISDPKNKICDRLGLRAMLVTVPKVNVISFVKVVEDSGVSVVDLDLAPIADFEEAKLPEMMDGIVGVINIGKDITTVSTFNKGIVTNSSIIKYGSRIIDEDISYVYYTTRKEAKKIKENFGIAHPRYSSKTEKYETHDVNDKLVSINQSELSEMINKRLVEILNSAKNELKVLTNKQISYIMVLGGITDMPAMGFTLTDVFGPVAKVHTINTLGIRKSRFATVSGGIKHFVLKIKLRGKEYSMFSSDDVDDLIHNKTRIGRSNSAVGRFISYFFDN
ncbi:MAG: hypothetical protein RSA10_01020 [Bacilli bacterium]